VAVTDGDGRSVAAIVGARGAVGTLAVGGAGFAGAEVAAAGGRAVALPGTAVLGSAVVLAGDVVGGTSRTPQPLSTQASRITSVSRTFTEHTFHRQNMQGRSK
jgi:hypothetical protein